MKTTRYKLIIYNWQEILFESLYDFTSEEEANGFRIGVQEAYKNLGIKTTNVHMEKI